jgi:hypothetical protein
MLWLQYADTIHHVPLYTCFGYLALDQAGAWLSDARRWRLGVIGGAVVLCILASYDFGLYLPILTAAAVWLSGRKLRDREVRPLLLVTAGAIVAAVIIKFALIAWATGPAHLVEDLLFQFEERATAKHSTNYKDGLWTIVLSRAWRFFTPLFFALIAVLMWSAWQRHKHGRAPVPLRPLFFFAAGAPFCLVFTQLLVEQYHPTLQIVPFYAVGFATLIVAMRNHARRAVRAGGLVVFGFLVAWQMRELIRFPKVLIEERDLHQVGAHLAEHDQRRYVLSNFLVDGPVRAYWRRHLVGLAALTEDEIDGFLRDRFARYGSEPIRFVEMRGAVDAFYDKLMFALLSGGGRWQWIAYPWNNRHKWRKRLGDRNEDLIEAVESRGVLEMSNARFRVYRFDAACGDRGWARQLAEDATEVDLGDPTSVRHKLHGFAASGPGPEGRAASLVAPRAVYEVQFTLQGLIDKPTGRFERRAAVQLHVLALPEGQVHVRVHGAPGESLTVALNGVTLGRAALDGSWQDLVFPVQLEAFESKRRLPYTTSPDIVVLTVDGGGGDVHVARVGNFAP